MADKKPTVKEMIEAARGGAPAPEPEKKEPEQGLGMFDSFTDKVAFGHGDTLEGVEAYLGALLTNENRWDAYKRARDAFRERRRNYAAANPVKNAVGEIGGTVAGGLALAGAGATTLPARAMTMKEAAVRGAIEGSIYSAAHAHGSADGKQPLRAAIEAIPGGAIGGAVMTPAMQKFADVFLSGGRALQRVPSAAALRNMGRQAYRRLERANPLYHFDDAAALQLRLSAGYELGTYPRIDTQLNRLAVDAQHGALSFNKLQQVRTQLAKIARGTDGEALAARDLRGAIDIFRQSKAPSEDVAQAVRIWHSAKKAGEVDFMALRGDVMAARGGTGGNVDNASRQAVAAPFLKEMDPTKAKRGWSPSEIQAMQRTIFSGSQANRPGNTGTRAMAHRVARSVGSMSPERGGLSMYPAIYGAVQGRPEFIAPAVIGGIGNRVNQAMTANNARLFEATVRNMGRPVPDVTNLGPIEQALIAATANPETRENAMDILRRSGLMED